MLIMGYGLLRVVLIGLLAQSMRGKKTAGVVKYDRSLVASVSSLMVYVVGKRRRAFG